MILQDIRLGSLGLSEKGACDIKTRKLMRHIQVAALKVEVQKLYYLHEEAKGVSQQTTAHICRSHFRYETCHHT